MTINVYSKRDLDHWDIVKIRYLMNHSSNPAASLKEVFGKRFNSRVGNALYFDNVTDKGVKTEIELKG